MFTALSLIVAAFVQRRVNHPAKEWIMAAAVLVVAGIFQYSTLAHLPMKDYRPYAIGQSIPENMKSAEELGLEGHQDPARRGQGVDGQDPQGRGTIQKDGVEPAGRWRAGLCLGPGHRHGRGGPPGLRRARVRPG